MREEAEIKKELVTNPASKSVSTGVRPRVLARK
jgi:hypothetical protein